MKITAIKQHPPIQIVDEHDVPIGGASLDETYKQGLRHRVVYIICEDPQGRILLQKRGPTMATYPNCWDVSAAGHVDEGETYETAAKRELKEELGLDSLPLHQVKYFPSENVVDNKLLNRFSTVYRADVPANVPLRVNPIEVTDTVWLTPAEIKQLAADKPDQIALGMKQILL